MENRFKMRISRMFRSSFGSCRSKDITDVIEKPIFLPEENNRQQPLHHHRHLIELLSPKQPRPFPSLSRATCPQGLQTDQTCNVSKNKKSPLLLTDAEGQKCPPASPMSPLMNSFYYDQYLHDCPAPSSSSAKIDGKNKKTKKPTSKRVRSRSRKSFGLHDEFPACSYINGLISSDEDDDDDDKTTLFSSRSLSSDSSESLRRSRSCKSAIKSTSKNHHRLKRGFVKDDSEIMGRSLPARLMEGKVQDSFAVVKRSSDPYNDFRTSMVEMIVERQMFSAQDLEDLLQCFLSLNSHQHHRVIIEVFTEIWEALFSNWS